MHAFESIVCVLDLQMLPERMARHHFVSNNNGFSLSQGDGITLYCTGIIGVRDSCLINVMLIKLLLRIIVFVVFGDFIFFMLCESQII